MDAQADDRSQAGRISTCTAESEASASAPNRPTVTKL